MSQFSEELLKQESSNLVYLIWIMRCCIVGLRIRLIALVLPFTCPVFCRFRIKLCHSFLRNCAKQDVNHGVNFEHE